MILLATLTTLVPYAFSAAAQAWLWLVEPRAFQAKHLVRDTVIALLAFAYSVWAIAGAGDDIVTKGFVLLLGRHPGLRRRCAGGSGASIEHLDVAGWSPDDRSAAMVGGNGAR